MAMIAGQLHANAVRVAGTDLSRLAIAAGLALEAGLTVWFSPHPGDLAGDDVVSYLAEAARTAEDLRSAAGSMVMMAGCELSLFCAGYLPGPTLGDRLDALTGASAVPDLQASFRELPRLLNTTLGQSVAAIRDHFRGPVSYASEGIHGAFWHTFAGWTFPHRPDPQADLDLGSFGLVKVIEDPSADKDEFVLGPKVRSGLWPPLIGRRAAPKKDGFLGGGPSSLSAREGQASRSRGARAEASSR